MPDIDIKVQELEDALKKMVTAMNEFDTLMSSFKKNSSGVLDDMNSDFMGIARKTLSHINDSMLADISESLDGYCSDINSVINNFTTKDEDLANGIKE